MYTIDHKFDTTPVKNYFTEIMSTIHTYIRHSKKKIILIKTITHIFFNFFCYFIRSALNSLHYIFTLLFTPFRVLLLHMYILLFALNKSFALKYNMHKWQLLVIYRYMLFLNYICNKRKV